MTHVLVILYEVSSICRPKRPSPCVLPQGNIHLWNLSHSYTTNSWRFNVTIVSLIVDCFNLFVVHEFVWRPTIKYVNSLITNKLKFKKIKSTNVSPFFFVFTSYFSFIIRIVIPFQYLPYLIYYELNKAWTRKINCNRSAHRKQREPQKSKRTLSLHFIPRIDIPFTTMIGTLPPLSPLSSTVRPLKYICVWYIYITSIHVYK